MKREILKGIYSKKFREQAVKQVQDEGLGRSGGETTIDAEIDVDDMGKSSMIGEIS